MRQLLIAFIDALIPIGMAVLLLLFPQWFTKKNLMIEENRNIARRLKNAAWWLLVAGALILFANLASTAAKK